MRLDPHERRKFRALVRSMLPAPLVYVAVAWAYLGLFGGERLFGPTLALTLAGIVGVATPLGALATYRTAIARGRADARLAQALLALAHGPGIGGFVLAAGTGQPWYTLVFGVEALAILLLVRSRVGAG